MVGQTSLKIFTVKENKCWELLACTGIIYDPSLASTDITQVWNQGDGRQHADEGRQHLHVCDARSQPSQTICWLTLHCSRWASLERKATIVQYIRPLLDRLKYIQYTLDRTEQSKRCQRTAKCQTTHLPITSTCRHSRRRERRTTRHAQRRSQQRSRETDLFRDP